MSDNDEPFFGGSVAVSCLNSSFTGSRVDEDIGANKTPTVHTGTWAPGTPAVGVHKSGRVQLPHKPGSRKAYPPKVCNRGRDCSFLILMSCSKIFRKRSFQAWTTTTRPGSLQQSHPTQPNSTAKFAGKRQLLKTCILSQCRDVTWRLGAARGCRIDMG